jgi:hypothetical protein
MSAFLFLLTYVKHRCRDSSLVYCYLLSCPSCVCVHLVELSHLHCCYCFWVSMICLCFSAHGVQKRDLWCGKATSASVMLTAAAVEEIIFVIWWCLWSDDAYLEQTHIYKPADWWASTRYKKWNRFGMLLSIPVCLLRLAVFLSMLQLQWYDLCKFHHNYKDFISLLQFVDFEHFSFVCCIFRMSFE